MAGRAATRYHRVTVVVTNLAVMDFVTPDHTMRLRSVHPGFAPEDIRANTGFEYEEPAVVPATARPDAATLSLLRGRILDELAEAYPAFARSMMATA